MGAGAAVVAELAAAGLTVRAYPGGRLQVGPGECLTDALRERIRQNKAAILAELLGSAELTQPAPPQANGQTAEAAPAVLPQASVSVPAPAEASSGLGATYTMPDRPALQRLWRERARELLGELESLPELSQEQEAEAAYYREILGRALVQGEAT